MEVGKELLRTQFGSHIYGTNVPTSDHDYKSVFVPSCRDILLQRASGPPIHKDTNPNPHIKNSSDDIDLELFTLQAFLRLCAEGQTAAVDMLFAPEKAWQLWTTEWEFIIKHREKLLHKGVSAFVGYCQTQAAKYGIKGSRMASVRSAVEFLDKLPQHERLLDQWHEIHNFVQLHQDDKHSSISKAGVREPFIKITACKGPHGKMEDHFEVNGRKIPKHALVKYAKEVFAKILDNYGERARRAEKNDGIDWKALMHAVRVCEEAKELLMTGVVTFPRPEKDLLLKIRKGEMAYKAVAEIIEEGVQDIDVAQERSTLPLSIDKEFWEKWLLDTYLAHVVESSVSVNPALGSNFQIR